MKCTVMTRFLFAMFFVFTTFTYVKAVGPSDVRAAFQSAQSQNDIAAAQQMAQGVVKERIWKAWLEDAQGRVAKIEATQRKVIDAFEAPSLTEQQRQILRGFARGARARAGTATGSKQPQPPAVPSVSKARSGAATASNPWSAPLSTPKPLRNVSSAEQSEEEQSTATSSQRFQPSTVRPVAMPPSRPWSAHSVTPRPQRGASLAKKLGSVTIPDGEFPRMVLLKKLEDIGADSLNSDEQAQAAALADAFDQQARGKKLADRARALVPSGVTGDDDPDTAARSIQTVWRGKQLRSVIKQLQDAVVARSEKQLSNAIQRAIDAGYEGIYLNRAQDALEELESSAAVSTVVVPQQKSVSPSAPTVDPTGSPKLTFPGMQRARGQKGRRTPTRKGGSGKGFNQPPAEDPTAAVFDEAGVTLDDVFGPSSGSAASSSAQGVDQGGSAGPSIPPPPPKPPSLPPLPPKVQTPAGSSTGSVSSDGEGVSRDEFLESIRAGTKLRKTPTIQKQQKQQAPTGFQQSLFDRMRGARGVDDDDDDDDDDWD